VTVAAKEKETAEQVAFLLRAENERITADQQRWDELRRATEQIESLSAHIRQADQEELQQLRAARDHTQALEAEHTTLQKRFKEQEARVANTERTAFTARQTLSQAQQRAAEWEKRAKENDAERIAAKEKLEETELARAQLETDLANALTRLEEKEADARLTKVWVTPYNTASRYSFFSGSRGEAQRSGELVGGPGCPA
jgi:chromosome segregation ATPase